MISLVVAKGKNNVIGKDGWMPWHLPEDLKTFRAITIHHTLAMGRTTFEAMKKPLKDRFTYVISRNKEYSIDFDNAQVCNDFDVLLKEYQNKDETLYICGGAKLYESALPYVDEIWISLVDKTYEGDTYFPIWDRTKYIEVSKEVKDGFTLYHYLKK